MTVAVCVDGWHDFFKVRITKQRASGVIGVRDEKHARFLSQSGDHLVDWKSHCFAVTVASMDRAPC